MILIDGTYRAFGNARPAIQTVVGIDIEHLLVLIETLGRADDCAVEVFAVDTGFGDDVSHEFVSNSYEESNHERRKQLRCHFGIA